MLGFRKWNSPGQRRNWWARQVSRQQSTNVPVTQFCRRLGVPTSTFYEWRRRFAQSGATSSGAAPVRRRLPNPVRHDRTRTMAASFVPVSIVGATADVQVEIELTNACVVRVKGLIDPSLLQAAIAAAAKLDSPGRGGC